MVNETAEKPADHRVNVIFDLDGTLTDPELGITRSLSYALERMGSSVPQRSTLRRYIGPPLREAFGELLDTTEARVIENAVAIYWERFGEVGLYENELYNGAAESLAQLARSGHRLFLATAKAEVYARRIIEHFGLGQHFAGIYGATLSGEGSHKSELLARILVEEQIKPGESVMIGDRGGDVFGARTNGMRSIAVLWGYGTEGELKDADRIVETWGELIEVVDGIGAFRSL